MIKRLIARVYVFSTAVVIGLVGAFLSLALVSAQSLDVDSFLTTKPYDDLFEGGGNAEENVDIGKLLGEEIQDETGLLQQLLEGLGFAFDEENKVIQFVNNLINLFLVVVGLVALAVIIFGFYKMFVSDGEEAWNDAKKLVINAGIALFVIGLAWFITSWAFDLFYVASEGV